MKAIGLLALLLTASSLWGDEGLMRGESGRYGGDIVTVGVDKKGNVTGYFFDGGCSFYLYGVLKSTGYAVVARDTNNPNSIEMRGLVRFREHKDRFGFFFQLAEIRQMESCAKVAPYLQRGDFLPQDSIGDWTSIRVVSAPQVNFYEAPATRKKKAYVVKGDVVHVYKSQDGWVEAQYEATRGWLKDEDLFPAK